MSFYIINHFIIIDLNENIDNETRETILGGIEYPTSGTEINQLCKFHGWTFSKNSQEVKIKIFFDEKLIYTAINGRPKFDIYQRFPFTENAYRSGFYSNLYLNDFADGDHTLRAIAYTDNAEKEIGIVSVKLKKVPNLWVSLRFDSDINKEGKKLPNVVKIYHDCCNLKPDNKILEIGCQYGRITMYFTEILSNEGTFDGIDIIPEAITSCTNNITPRYPNFNFTLVDLYNKWYNPNGKIKTSEYQLPFPDKSFDFTCLVSVFTHMLPSDMKNYIKEISRVLKTGGICLITYFLLNDNSIKIMTSNKPNQKNFRYQKDGYKTTNNENPEAQTAYEESTIRKLYDTFNLQILEPIQFGNWALEEKTKLHPQDVVIATKK